MMQPHEARVLVVDDMKTMRKIVMKCLSDIGITNIVEADDGTTAWETIQLNIKSNTPINLVLSDWNMPVMKGIELLKKVRTQDATKSLPFFLVTAEKETSQVVEAATLGVTGYITKPFTPEILKTKLAVAFK